MVELEECNRATAVVCQRQNLRQETTYQKLGFIGCVRFKDDIIPEPDFVSDHNTIQQCVEICRGLDQRIALLQVALAFLN